MANRTMSRKKTRGPNSSRTGLITGPRRLWNGKRSSLRIDVNHHRRCTPPQRPLLRGRMTPPNSELCLGFNLDNADIGDEELNTTLSELLESSELFDQFGNAAPGQGAAGAQATGVVPANSPTILDVTATVSTLPPSSLPLPQEAVALPQEAVAQPRSQAEDAALEPDAAQAAAQLAH